ncbi:MAG: hypothetical protein K2O91_22140 [Lachnospiraceae bacterium]|nr:hypothetical protein [Lachnospiraceae bacterium]
MVTSFMIPLLYKEGTYRLKDFHEDFGDSIDFDYDAQYQIFTYMVPVGEDCRHRIRLYQIPEETMTETLKAYYDENGQLQKITAWLYEKESLLYIHYADLEDARQKIKCFAVSNADAIAELVCANCTDVVARLFIEYFWDGEAIDFHALSGTPEQKEALEREYPEYDDIGDNSGDYFSDRIYGDNHTFGIMLCCAEYEQFDFFQYAVDIMTERVREKTVDRLQKTDDFKFIALQYD